MSSILGVDSETLEQTGAFDSFVDIDSQFHVDPHLLDSSQAPELKGARARFDDYFADVLKLLLASKREDDVFWTEARRRLTFPEIAQTGLGYSREDVSGSGVGPKLARALTNVAKQIIDAGVNEPEIFDLIGVLQENVGPDRISDIAVRVILPHFLAFSQRVATMLKVRKVEMQIGGSVYSVPFNPATGRAIFLVPKDVLRPLPIALSWSDIDRVAAHNADLRRRVNKIIGNTWKKATTKIAKKKLREVLLENPDLIRDLIDQYRKKPAEGYDFKRDPDALVIWYQLAQQFALEEPLGLTISHPITSERLVDVVTTICDRFRSLVESNRYGRILYNDDGSPRKEKIAQIAFFGLADAYCEANKLDISPEADGGAGPVDFKISSGYEFRSTVEVKLSSNTKLVSGFLAQLPAYNAAEKAVHSVYFVIQNGAHDSKIKSLRRARREAIDRGQRVPNLVVVDGRQQPSASRRSAPARRQ